MALYLFFILLVVVKTLLHSRQNPHLVYSLKEMYIKTLS